MENEMKSDVAWLRGECAADIAIVVAALKRCDMNLHGYGKCGTLTGGGDWTCPQCAAIAAIKRLERLFLTPCPCEGLQEDCERLQGLLAAEYGRTQDLQAERDSLRADLAKAKADYETVYGLYTTVKCERDQFRTENEKHLVCNQNQYNGIQRLRAELAKAIEGQGILGEEIAALRAELAAATNDCRKANVSIERVYDALDVWGKWDGEPHTVVAHIIAELAASQERERVLRADKERLDWLNVRKAIDKARSYTAPSPERPSTADEGLSISEEEL
jgi:hypothetical protein